MLVVCLGRQNGTGVAICRIEMRWSETFAIYLATGAPFGVSCYVRNCEGDRSVTRFLKASFAGLVWPLALLRILLIRYELRKSTENNERLAQESESKVDEAKRSLLSALNRLNELAATNKLNDHQELERASCVLRGGVEAYVGLMPTAGGSAASMSPNGYSRELFRIAGYEERDLEIAATCINRRNGSRVVEHHNRARIQMVHAIADLCESIHPRNSFVAPNGNANGVLHVAARKVYDNAIDLFEAMGDHETAKKIHEVVSREQNLKRGRTQKTLLFDIGEVSCDTQATRLSQVPQPNEASIARG